MGKALSSRYLLPYKPSLRMVQGADGKLRDSWGITATRIIDLAVTPDFTRLVAVGESAKDPLPTSRSEAPAASAANRNGSNNTTPSSPRTLEYLMIVYDLITKQPELYGRFVTPFCLRDSC